MHGVEWAKRFEATLAIIDLSAKTEKKEQTFAGVGGHVMSDTVKIFPVGIQKRHGEIHSAETPGNAPLLLSRPFMEELDTTIDIGKNTVSFRTLGVLDLPLLRTSRGHLAVSFLDFDEARLDSFTKDPAPEQIADEADWDQYRPADVNPGDWEECNLEHAHLRAEVESFESYQREMWSQGISICGYQGEPSPVPDEGLLCEDSRVFEAMVTQQPELLRKATHKKTKKLHAISIALDGEDWHQSRVLQGKNTIPKTPPYGKTWMKQLFAGQMGLTLLFVAYGMTVGIPLDSSSSSWCNHEARPAMAS